MAGDETAEAREQAYSDFVEGNLKRNYIAHFTHGMLGMTGFRLIFAPTFVPAYLHMLTGSPIFVGIGQALIQLAARWPRTRVSRTVDGRARMRRAKCNIPCLSRRRRA